MKYYEEHDKIISVQRLVSDGDFANLILDF